MHKKFLLSCGAALLSTAMLSGQGLDTTQKKGDWEEIDFAFNSAVLTDGYPSLLRLAELLNRHSDYRVTLEGHADHIGSDSYNMALGRKRAETVRDFLAKYGAQASQFSIESYGEQRPIARHNAREGRWMNRRVKITVTDAQGNIISDGGVGEAIASLDDVIKAQGEWSDKILKQLEKLDNILAALESLKDENQSLKDEIDNLKQAQRTLEDKLAAAPEPATEAQVRDIVRDEVPKPSKKFARYSLLAGPDSDGGNLTVSGSGQLFLPFAEKHALQAQGEYLHSFGRDEGQVDLGIVNRFGPVQAGLFSSFKYVKFSDLAHAGALGQAAGTLDYVFPRGRVGIFGTKGFMDGAILNTRSLASNFVEETYLSIVDQFGFSTAVAAWGDSWFEGNLGAQRRRFADNKVGGRIRFIAPITDRLAFTVGGGLNETLISDANRGSFAVGLEFGKWLSPKNYGETTGPVPVDVPRIRYEVLTRTVRTGNDLPIADAGPDQIRVESGTIVLDGSRSSDPDGDPITFEWEQVGGPVVTLSSPNAAQTSFTADEGQTYDFRLTVSDEHNGVGTDDVMVSTLDRKITILRFSAEPLRIPLGDSATLVWEVRNATTVEIFGIGEVDPEGGSTTVSPTETTTYTLTASNPKRTVSQTITITVDREITILHFSAEPLRIPLGDSATLVWEVRNATTVEIFGIGEVDPEGGSTTVSPTETTTYTLTASNPERTVSQTITITVDRTITILRFSAEPPRITTGNSATLVWEVRNATTVEISGIGAVSPEGGSTTVSPTETTTYTLTASNPKRTVSQTITITVDPLPEPEDPPIIANFVAQPSVILLGGQTTLSWDVQNATDVSISGIGSVDPQGSIMVSPDRTTEYTLTARNSVGEASANVRVTVGFWP